MSLFRGPSNSQIDDWIDIAKNIGVLQAENEALRRELAEAKQDRDHWREMAMRSQFQRPFFDSPAMDGTCFACGEKHGGLVCPRTVPTAAGFPPGQAGAGVRDGVEIPDTDWPSETTREGQS